MTLAPLLAATPAIQIHAFSALAAIVLAVPQFLLRRGVRRHRALGYAWTVAMIMVSQVMAVLGWGAWFPWSVPALLAGAGGASVDPVTLPGVLVVVVVAVAFLVATIAWWERADQTG